VKTVVLGEPPTELEQLIARRRALGLDTFDELWEGSYHVAPAARFRHAYLDDAVAAVLRPYAEACGLTGSGPFNLGQPGDYRVPDRGLHRRYLDAVYLETAAVVIEILSEDDETYEKFDFYAGHGVDEVIVVEPESQRVRLFQLQGDGYNEIDHSAVLAVTAEALTAAIPWP
jgi:Uma2 family endonuclease